MTTTTSRLWLVGPRGILPLQLFSFFFFFYPYFSRDWAYWALGPDTMVLGLLPLGSLQELIPGIPQVYLALTKTKKFK